MLITDDVTIIVVKIVKTNMFWVVVSNIFVCSPLFGEDSHFGEHMFQMGWFNHQLVFQVGNCMI